MTKLMRGLAMIAALLAAGWLASPALAEKPAQPKKAGVLHVYGNSDTKLFSEDGIKRAELAMHSAQFEGGMMLTVDTYHEVPASKKAEADKVKNDKGQWRTFMNNWALERAKDDKAKGIYILICQSPGGVAVRSTKQTLDRGFSDSDAEKIQDSLIHAFRESRGKSESERLRIHDQALDDAVSYIVDDLKDTHVPASATTKSDTNKKAGMSVGGWICLGLCILLGVWLVIGIIRALTGGGGGGGYGGGGYGGGGGGFGSSLLGGLFGAMAGMWLYNSMFGGHHDMGSNDAFAGDGGGDTGGDTGADNWDDGGGSAGGDGGDWGGGGGDMGGGGGDWGGGGGGDFGGDF